MKECDLGRVSIYAHDGRLYKKSSNIYPYIVRAEQKDICDIEEEIEKLKSLMESEPHLMNGVYVRETKNIYLFEEGYLLKKYNTLSHYNSIEIVHNHTSLGDNDRYFTLVCNHDFALSDHMQVRKRSKEEISSVINNMIDKMVEVLCEIEPVAVLE